MYTYVFDAYDPMGANHFGAEHVGMTAYGALFDMTGGNKTKIGPTYTTLMSKMGYAKWTWANSMVAGHVYVVAIFDDMAPTMATCTAGDAGWVFPVGGTQGVTGVPTAAMLTPVQGDVTFTFPTGHATRDDGSKCMFFPGPVTDGMNVAPP
jgi:hypothetical protein